MPKLSHRADLKRILDAPNPVRQAQAMIDALDAFFELLLEDDPDPDGLSGEQVEELATHAMRLAHAMRQAVKR